MSMYANVFVKTHSRIRDFALEFGRILGKAMVHKQSDNGDIYETEILGTHLVIFDHPGLEDDKENHLEFTQYQIQIDIGPTTGGQTHDALVQAMSIYLASEISAKLKYPTMVTVGLRKLIGTFA